MQTKNNIVKIKRLNKQNNDNLPDKQYQRKAKEKSFKLARNNGRMNKRFLSCDFEL